ncbi:MAG: HAMP domain-containing protein [Chromatiaceae bacterium]|jgi:signal transduction histidine kinase|nr:HAMP domain-containing protein [Chromatiaceae bacterium]
MRNRLLWKLLGINIPVIAGVILVVWLAIDYLAAGYFTVLMNEYHISPDEANGIFLDAIHRYLLWASLCALGLAGALSFLLTRKVLRPLFQMMEVTGRLAAGDYGARVHVTSNDEIGQLGFAFNHMADSLRRIEQLRKTMVADAAHELRTPLTNIRGYLEALHDGVIPPSKATFSMLQLEILRLTKLSEDLLLLARADTAKRDIRRQSLSLRRLVEKVLDLNRPRFETKKLAIEVRISKDADRVVADRDKLLQVVTNLADNGWQYTPEGGHLVISTERTEAGIRTTFANTGEAIAEEDIPFIFERFFRADKSRSREHGGAGIGLSIVKELVEAHGGQVGAASAAGENRIWFILPA